MDEWPARRPADRGHSPGQARTSRLRRGGFQPVPRLRKQVWPPLGPPGQPDRPSAPVQGGRRAARGQPPATAPTREDGGERGGAVSRGGRSTSSETRGGRRGRSSSPGAGRAEGKRGSRQGGTRRRPSERGLGAGGARGGGEGGSGRADRRRGDRSRSLPGPRPPPHARAAHRDVPAGRSDRLAEATGATGGAGEPGLRRGPPPPQSPSGSRPTPPTPRPPFSPRPSSPPTRYLSSRHKVIHTW